MYDSDFNMRGQFYQESKYKAMEEAAKKSRIKCPKCGSSSLTKTITHIECDYCGFNPIPYSVNVYKALRWSNEDILNIYEKFYNLLIEKV